MLSTATDTGGGTGGDLPTGILIAASISAGLSTILSLATVWLQLKHYHKPRLQRLVVRILVMVPIYSISSLISLYSLDLAFFLDAFRDVYEAFVIYCFFSLLVEYLGGERSLIITLHGRDPVPHPFPVNLFLSPMDASDPYTFLGLKRGVLQYVQLKPLLALITVVLKATGTYRDGSFARDSGYTYISIAYNLSVTLSLYCLAMFWVATNADLKPYRPMPKFLSVKGIIFFSFWQGFGVSILVAAGWLRSSRMETEKLSVAVQDTLVCLEMPLFAFLHLYAFSHTDYIDKNHVLSGRLPIWYALRDSFGFKDLFLDSVTTLRGTGFSYRTYEPASGTAHASGIVRDRRIRAGLRYSVDGRRKYWLNQPGLETDAYGRKGENLLSQGLAARPIHEARKLLEERLEAREGHAPLSHEAMTGGVVHVDPKWAATQRASANAGLGGGLGWWEGGRAYESIQEDEDEGQGSDVDSLDFHDPRDADEKDVERLYREAREHEYGDWSYPVLDASREAQRRRIRHEEDAILRGHPQKRPGANHCPRSYGAMAERHQASSPSDPTTDGDHPVPVGTSVLHAACEVAHTILPRIPDPSERRKMLSIFTRRRDEEENRLPPDAVDLVVADLQAEEEEQIRQRRRGEPGGKPTRVYRIAYVPPEERGVPSPQAEHRKPHDELDNPLKDEHTQVKDLVDRDEELDGPVPRPASSSGSDSPSPPEEREPRQVVRVEVHQEEQMIRQAGADERTPSATHGVLAREDNPWG
ncbi:hypothetical protein JCM10908_001774 [Rhodotorula pacifica]|uniref:OSTA/TMEM184 family protein n=1 Tax=Rhodotorula pacifica TaxID=1495444 RepID=UPI0031809F26